MEEIHSIVAMTLDRVIGKNNGIPWTLHSDLRRFREITVGHPVIMGAKTFLSLKRPLEDRTNIVITVGNRNEVSRRGGSVVVSSPEAALVEAKRCGKHAFVIGGATIYKYFLPQTKVLHLTMVQASIKGDAYFPEELNFRQWDNPQVVAPLGRHDPKDQYLSSYAIYRRH